MFRWDHNIMFLRAAVCLFICDDPSHIKHVLCITPRDITAPFVHTDYDEEISLVSMQRVFMADNNNFGSERWISNLQWQINKLEFLLPWPFITFKGSLSGDFCVVHPAFISYQQWKSSNKKKLFVKNNCLSCTTVFKWNFFLSCSSLIVGWWHFCLLRVRCFRSSNQGNFPPNIRPWTLWCYDVTWLIRIITGNKAFLSIM